MNPLQAHIKSSIQDFGFATLAIHDHDSHTTFTYSVGFTDLGHSEVLIYGLRQELAHQFLWTLYNAIKSGKTFETDVPYDELANLPTVFKHMTGSNIREYCVQGVQWYGKTVDYMQMVLPDKDGKMPWETGYDAHLMRCQKELWETIQ